MNLLFRITGILMCYFGVIAHPQSLNAALVFTFQDTSVVAGSSGSIEVFVSSTGTDFVTLMNFEFAITGSDPSGVLNFNPIQTAAAEIQNDPRYIFFNDSAAYGVNLLDPITLVGGDSKASLPDVMVGGSPLLLARLQLEHITPTPLVSTGTYKISLVQGLNSIFFDKDLGEVDIDASSFVNFGTVTISAVPEPSSILLSGAMAAVLGLRSRKLFRKKIRDAFDRSGIE